MLEKIGIDFSVLVFQVVNFLILVWVLKKFLYKPILDMIDKRQKEIDEGLKLKDSLKTERDKISNERDQILKEAREESQLLIESKKKEAQKVYENLLKEGREEKKKIVEQGYKEIESQRLEVENKLQKETVELAVNILEKVLGKTLSVKDQHAIIQKELDQLSKSQFKN